MLILAIDTSCDDTSASLVDFGEDGTPRILSNVISSQTLIHAKYGGIVPELASRRHNEMIWAVVSESMAAGHTALEELSAIAVCAGPGLIGSLLVGCSFAKAVSFSKKFRWRLLTILKAIYCRSFWRATNSPMVRRNSPIFL